MSLPTGSVTFLLTDVESSARLWEEQPDAMARAIERHETLAAEIIARWRGVLLKRRGEGDSLFAVFEHARDAVAAVCDLQLAFEREPWPPGTPLRVRMALHMGWAQERDSDYFGPVVNRCGRLRAIAHGGQALISAATFEAVRDDLPAHARITDLGPHPLRDLREPERVYQIAHRDVVSEFPPLLSPGSLPNNLPVELTSFVGREEEMEQVRRRMANTHLLTLLGMGGFGKTRLALRLAADLLGEYPDGVWLVELATLSDPSLVPNAVASTLKVKEQGTTLLDTLCDYFRGKSVLLILDNCEHLIEAVAGFAEVVLRRCAHLRILATSREALKVAGESIYAVPPLSLPEREGTTGPDALLAASAAARLFVERAAGANPNFGLTAANASAVARICRRLDGIPLALELAAARVRLLTVEQIALRLDDRFRLLTGGSRTALARQQTLRALIDWSYDLLSPEEQTLLCRLSVFADGWTLEAAEAVCAGGGIAGDILDLLGLLVDRSLVQVEQSGAGPRYRLLETLRQYGGDRLAERGEAEAARARHRDYFLALAEAAEPHWRGSDEAAWLERLETEHDNFRAVLAGPMDHEPRLRLAYALWWFWYVRGYLGEGRRWLEEALAQRPEAPEAVRAQALNGAGVLAWSQGDYAAARRHHEECLAIWRKLGNGRFEARSLNHLAMLAMDEKRYAEAGDLYEQSEAICRDLGDQASLAAVLINRGGMVFNLGDYRAARPLFEQSLALSRAQNDKGGMAAALGNLGDMALREGDIQAARADMAEALRLRHELGDKSETIDSLMSLGLLAQAEGEHERAAQLLGSAEAIRELVGSSLKPSDHALYESAINGLCRSLGEAALTAAWARGRQMSIEEVIPFALNG